MKYAKKGDCETFQFHYVTFEHEMPLRKCSNLSDFDTHFHIQHDSFIYADHSLSTCLGPLEFQG